jgi:hypothetical protein
MIVTDSGQVSRLSSDYARNGYALIPGLVDPAVAAGWELKYRSLPGRNVRAGRESSTLWIEQRFAHPPEALDGLAFAGAFLDLVGKITGLAAFDPDQTEVWINRYRPGDCVATHCDRGGSTQLVLCLQGLSEPEKGGDLFINKDAVPLRTGDAVLFFARGKAHGTTPIGGTKLGPSGFSRVTCVIRLYALGNP